jgi:hypothetical protein
LTYSEFHGLCTGSTKLPGNDDLATLGTGLHDESKNTIACSSNRETVQQLVPEGLALSNSTKTAVLNFCGIEGDGILGELEPLLDERGKFADAASLITEDLLCVGGTDDCASPVSVRPNVTSLFTISFHPSNSNRSAGDILISVTVGVTRTSTPE